MAAGEYEIELLTADLAAQEADALAALDAALVAELGDRFAESAWDAESFTTTKPEKWSLSVIAVADGQPAGYWIASQPSPDEVHVHRVGVAAEHRRGGLGHRLYESAVAAARKHGAQRLTLFVSSTNQEARAFYRGLGFVPIGDDELRRLAEVKSMAIEQGGLRSGRVILHAMVLPLDA